MPKLHRLAQCALSAVSFLVLASPAHASLESWQDQYVTLDPIFSPYSVDYTILGDGVPRYWDFEIQSADPSATLTLWKPNEVFTVFTKVGAGGTLDFDFEGSSPYVFSEIYKGPGLVSYLVWAPKSFDTCDTPGPVGSVCKAAYYVWGNGVGLNLDSDAPVTIHFTSTVVPEPQTWALMILGFGGAGAMLRRRRRLAA